MLYAEMELFDYIYVDLCIVEKSVRSFCIAYLLHFSIIHIFHLLKWITSDSCLSV